MEAEYDISFDNYAANSSSWTFTSGDSSIGEIKDLIKQVMSPYIEINNDERIAVMLQKIIDRLESQDKVIKELVTMLENK